jgi:hypothetical protein
LKEGYVAEAVEQYLFILKTWNEARKRSLAKVAAKKAAIKGSAGTATAGKGGKRRSKKARKSRRGRKRRRRRRK